MRKVSFLFLFLLSIGSFASENNGDISISKYTPSVNVASNLTHSEEFLSTLYVLRDSIVKPPSSRDSSEYTNSIPDQEDSFSKILSLIKSGELLTPPSRKSEVFNLSRKMKTNQSSHYEIAYNRDFVRLETINNELILVSAINGLINLRSQFASIEDIKYLISSTLSSMENNPNIKKINAAYDEYKDAEGAIAEDFKTNYVEYKRNLNFYLVMLEYLNVNSVELYRSNLLVESLSIDYWSDRINENEVLDDINSWLSYIKTDFSRLMFAIIALLLINSLRIFIIPLVVSFIQRGIHIKDKTKEKQDLSSTRKRRYLLKSSSNPVKMFLGILSVEVAIRIIHNGQFNIETISVLFNSLYAITFALLIYNLLNEWLNFYSIHFFSHYPNIRKEMIGFLIKFAKVSLFTVVLLFTLNEFGFNVGAIVASLGVGGIAVALAAKDSLTNIFGGISIMLDDSLRQGDWIVSDSVEGTVIEIRMRTTTVRTFDNAFVTVPNSQLASGAVKNWSRRVVGRRIKMFVGVTYESNPEDIKNAVLEIKTMLHGHEKISVEERVHHSVDNHAKLTKMDDEYGIKKTLLVHVDSFKSSSIDIQIYCFAETVDWEEWLDVKQDVMYKIMDIITTNNLEFAYPTSVNWLKGSGSESFSDILIR